MKLVEVDVVSFFLNIVKFFLMGKIIVLQFDCD